MPQKIVKKLIKSNKSTASITPKIFKKLLSRQTETILDAVDERLARTDERIANIDRRLAMTDERISLIEQRLVKSEERFNRKLDDLMTALDKFLKRLMDTEDEFAIMKLDINRIKKVIREKLKVELS